MYEREENSNGRQNAKKTNEVGSRFRWLGFPPRTPAEDGAAGPPRQPRSGREGQRGDGDPCGK